MFLYVLLYFLQISLDEGTSEREGDLCSEKKLNISFYGHSHNVDGDEQEIKKEILADEND